MKWFILASIFILTGCQSATSSKSAKIDEVASITVFEPAINSEWIGDGISYSPYRDGESPEIGSLTSKENILEDLMLISQHWNLIRLYGAGEVSERIIEVIEEHDLPIKVLQGAWVSGSQTQTQNDAEVNSAISLAQRYPNTVVAVNIGNEALVYWSGHRVSSPAVIIDYVEQAKKAIEQPVTVFDDYNFWNKPEAQELAEVVDFIGLHAYAFWNNVPLETSVSWTQDIFKDIQQRYPQKQLVIGETGWPTSRIYNDGSYEGGLVGIASVANMNRFYDEFTQWIKSENIVSFYFEAFDEKWKGGFDGVDPDAKAEKNWGLFYSDRQPKISLPANE